MCTKFLQLFRQQGCQNIRTMSAPLYPPLCLGIGMSMMFCMTITDLEHTSSLLGFLYLLKETCSPATLTTLATLKKERLSMLKRLL